MNTTENLPHEEAIAKLRDWKTKAVDGRAACTLVGMTSEAAALEAAEREIDRQNSVAQAEAARLRREAAGTARPAPQGLSPASSSTPAGSPSSQQVSDLVGPNGEVSAAQFGSDWPLQLSSGRIVCRAPSMVFFLPPGGPLYAVNGSAQGCVNNDHPGCAGIKPVLIDPIWLDDTKLGHGLKKSIGPLIGAGLAYCERHGR